MNNITDYKKQEKENYDDRGLKKHEKLKSNIYKKTSNKENVIENSDFILGEKIINVKDNLLIKKKYLIEQKNWKKEFSDLSNFFKNQQVSNIDEFFSKMEFFQINNVNNKENKEMLYKKIVNIIGIEKYKLIESYLKEEIKCEETLEEIICFNSFFNTEKKEKFLENLRNILNEIISVKDEKIIVKHLIDSFLKSRKKIFFESIEKIMNEDTKKTKDEWLNSKFKIDEIMSEIKKITNKINYIKDYLILEKECVEIKNNINNDLGVFLKYENNCVLNFDENEKQIHLIDEFSRYFSFYNFDENKIKKLEGELKRSKNYLLNLEEKFSHLEDGMEKDGCKIKIMQVRYDINDREKELMLINDKNFLKNKINKIKSQLGIDPLIEIENLDSAIKNKRIELEGNKKLMDLQKKKLVLSKKMEGLNHIAINYKNEFMGNIESDCVLLDQFEKNKKKLSKSFDKEIENYLSLKNKILFIKAIKLKKNELKKEEKLIEKIKEEWSSIVEKIYKREKKELNLQKTKCKGYELKRQDAHTYYKYQMIKRLTPEFLAGHFKTKMTLLDQEKVKNFKGRFGSKSISRKD